MKKTFLTIAIVLGMSFGAKAQDGMLAMQGGLFGLGETSDNTSPLWFLNTDRTYGLLDLPDSHGLPDDQNAPLGGGALLLTALGVAYALGKKHKED